VDERGVPPPGAKLPYRLGHQTTNLGVRSSYLFGRASKNGHYSHQSLAENLIAAYPESGLFLVLATGTRTNGRDMHA
jgi:hypothetical protein